MSRTDRRTGGPRPPACPTSRRKATGRRLALVAGLVLAAAPAWADGALPSFRRGFNTALWFYRAKTIDNDPRRFDPNDTWPYLSAFTGAEFERLQRAGADVIRIPVQPSPFLAAEVPQRDRLIAVLMGALDRVTGLGMTAIVDLHPDEGQPAWSSRTILQSPALSATYQDVVVALARALAARPGHHVMLELMNEPASGWEMGDHAWVALQQRLVHAVRAVAPTLPLLLTGDRSGLIQGLSRLDPTGIDDPAVAYSIHYYDPMVITHQGADWTDKAYRRDLAGVPYPPDAAAQAGALQRLQDRVATDPKAGPDKAAVVREGRAALQAYFDKTGGRADMERDFGKAEAWASLHGIPAGRILLGEFGVLRPGASAETAAHWIGDARRTAEADGFGWTYFDYAPFDGPTGSFGIHKMTGPDAEAFEPLIVEEALGLRLP